MPSSKKSWHEKLHDSKDLPRVGPVTGKMTQRWGQGTMVIPAPIEVDEIMRTVRKGQLITIEDIRRRLATKHGADFTCPITTGIFAWIAAHAADEAEQDGKKKITPYWRTLKTGGEINPKYPGGVANIRARLEAEGHTIVARGRRHFVEPKPSSRG
jgi:hypothetical protein